MSKMYNMTLEYLTHLIDLYLFQFFSVLMSACRLILPRTLRCSFINPPFLVIKDCSPYLEVLFSGSETTFVLNNYDSTTTHVKILCRYWSYKAGKGEENFESLEEALEPDPIFTATEKRYYPYSFRYLWTLRAPIFSFSIPRILLHSDMYHQLWFIFL
jgi:hypothetical protein